MTSNSLKIDDQKHQLRKLMRERRIGFAEPGHDLAITETALAIINDMQGDHRAGIAGYWPMAGEVDSRPLLTTLYDIGHQTSLPMVIEPAVPLGFRQWAPDMALDRGRFGIPVPSASAAELVPDILLVPLVAFDRNGYRLGMGGGFYDRTIAALKALKPIRTIGLAYAAQAVSAVPVDAFDQPLDWIITEQEAMSMPTRP